MYDVTRAPFPVRAQLMYVRFLPNTLTVWEEEPYVLEKVAQDRRREIAGEILRIKEAGGFNH